MKTTRYIIISIALLAAVAVFVWQESIPFLSSSAINEPPPSTHSQYLKLQINPLIWEKAYTRVVLEAIIKTQHSGCREIVLNSALREDTLDVFYTCRDNLVTTETIIPQTTSDGTTEVIVTTEKFSLQ